MFGGEHEVGQALGVGDGGVLAQVAELGLHSERVEAPSEVAPALERALARLDEAIALVAERAGQAAGPASD